MAKDFFDSEVTMTILNQSEEDERTGKKEHVVFHMVQKEKVAKRKHQKGSEEEIQAEKKVCKSRKTLQKIWNCCVFLL